MKTRYSPLVMTVTLGVALGALLVSAPAAPAQIITNNTLHAFCTGSTPCFDETNYGGVPVIRTTSGLPTFGFTRSPDSNQNLPADAKIVVVALVPNTALNAASLSFTVNGTHTGVSSQAATLFSSTAWTTNITLAAYLGRTQTGGPANPLDAWLPASQVLNSSATGYYVYQANLGSVTFGATTDPTFTISGIAGLPAGTVFMAYMVGTGTQGQNTIANAMVDSTANSSALLLNPELPKTPEPGAMALLGSGLLVVGGAMKRFRAPKA